MLTKNNFYFKSTKRTKKLIFDCQQQGNQNKPAVVTL